MRFLINLIYFLSGLMLLFSILVLLEAKKNLEAKNAILQESLIKCQEEKDNLERLEQQTMYLYLNGYKEE